MPSALKGLREGDQLRSLIQHVGDLTVARDLDDHKLRHEQRHKHQNGSHDPARTGEMPSFLITFVRPPRTNPSGPHAPFSIIITTSKSMKYLMRMYGLIHLITEINAGAWSMRLLRQDTLGHSPF